MGRRIGCVVLAMACLASRAFGAAPAPLAIHEWGTFTSLQDEQGKAVGGINTDDEPVPKFVHRLTSWLRLSATDIPNQFYQGTPACHPDVTMRLETPVLYFHVPAGQGAPRRQRAGRVSGWLAHRVLSGCAGNQLEGYQPGSATF